MAWIDRARDGFRRWFRRGAEERALTEEFSFHLEREIERHVAAGKSRLDAERAALLSFGSQEQYREEARDTWTPLVDGLAADLRWSARRLRSHAGFTATAVLTLGLGIGASTAIFGLVRSVLLQPLPYHSPDRLVMFWMRSGDVADDSWFSLREVLEYRKSVPSLADVGAYTTAAVNLAVGEPERARSAIVTANFFTTLGASAEIGRTFGPGDGAESGDRVVLSHALWQRQFGGASDVVGRSMRISGRPYTVIGVMPSAFRMPLDYREERPVELFRLLVYTPRDAEAWGDRSYYIVGRLQPGVGTAAVDAEMDRAHMAWQTDVMELRDDKLSERLAFPMSRLLFRDVRQALFILFGAVGLLLLVACANVAHLLLARGDARRREIATQAALGAGRPRLVRQLLVESGLLAFAGAAAGVALAYGTVAVVLAAAPVNAIRMRGVAIDTGVLLFACGVALLATLAAGLWPALRLSRTGAADALAGARGEGSAVRSGPRRLLVAGEMALSLVLILCASLLARSYAQLRGVDLGFDPSRALAVRVDLAPADYPNAADVVRVHRDLIDRVAALPGVKAAGSVRILPLTATIGDWSITLEHRPRQPGENPNGDWQIVTPGYFEALGISTVRGRAIEPRDDETAPLVAVINETMAAQYWPGEDALGKRFHLGTSDQPWIEIVGIARDVHHNAVIEHNRAEMFIPHAQWTRSSRSSPRHGMTLVVKTEGDPLNHAAQVRQEIRALDPRVPLTDVRTLEGVAAAALAEPRFTTLVLSAFAGLALLLAAVGLYGVVSFVAARRTREIGVRVALGAGAADVRWLVVRDGLATSGAGVIVGLVVSGAATSALASQLYGVSRLDPAAIAAAPIVLLVVTALASYLPARRAARLNPVTALRND
jgi:putative ABC transport system permease protein